MPTQPNQRMDQLLRAYARQRRQEAGLPLQMHSATRNLLQSEVARTYRDPGSSRSSRAVELSQFWPRLILGTSALALLLIGSGLWLRYDEQRVLKMAEKQDSNLFFFAQSAPERIARSDRENVDVPDRVRGFELAENTPKNEGAAAAKEAKDAPGSVDSLAFGRPAAGPDVAANAPSAARPLTEQQGLSEALRSRYGLASRPALVEPTMRARSSAVGDGPAQSLEREAKPDSSAGLISGEGRLALSLSATPAEPLASNQGARPERESRIEQQPLPVAAGASLAANSNPPALLGASFAYGRQGEQSLHFQQVDVRNKYRQNLNSPPPSQVLTAFEMQRSAENVRIVDADGSVYLGRIQAAAEKQAPAPSGARIGSFANQQQVAFDNAMPALVRENAAMPPFSFRAVGTNRTLRQVVVFTGEFEPASTSPDQTALNQAVNSANLANQAPAVQSAQQLVRARSTPATLNRGITSLAANSTAESNRLLTPGRIEGRASVGTKNQFRIEAQQVGP